MCQPGRPAPHGDSHCGSPGFADFPEGKVDRAALEVVDLDARAGALEQFGNGPVRQLAVAGKRVDLEVHPVSFDHVRTTSNDQLRDQRLHLTDELGRVRDVVGGLTFSRCEVAPVRVLVHARQLGLGRLPLRGAGDDAILDVGDVADELHVEAAPLEIATDGIEDDCGTAVAEMRIVVRRRAAHVHRDVAGHLRHELDLGASRGVVDAEHRRNLLSRCAALGGDCARASLARATARRTRARELSDFTVPGRHPSSIAISSSDSPSPVAQHDHRTLAIGKRSDHVAELAAHLRRKVRPGEQWQSRPLDLAPPVPGPTAVEQRDPQVCTRLRRPAPRSVHLLEHVLGDVLTGRQAAGERARLAHGAVPVQPVEVLEATLDGGCIPPDHRCGHVLPARKTAHIPRTRPFGHSTGITSFGYGP